MSHTCPHCNAELRHEDTYFRNFMRERLGDIYRCPNHEGFPSEEEAREFDPETTDWTEIVCHSAVHHVSGSFYTDKQDNLHEGYPC